jgi:hypothetical protein
MANSPMVHGVLEPRPRTPRVRHIVVNARRRDYATNTCVRGFWSAQEEAACLKCARAKANWQGSQAHLIQVCVLGHAQGPPHKVVGALVPAAGSGHVATGLRTQLVATLHDGERYDRSA